MSHHTESVLDKIIEKIHTSILNEKPPKLTGKENDFLQDTPEMALLLIKKLLNTSLEYTYQIACLELLAQPWSTCAIAMSAARLGLFDYIIK